MIGLWAAYDQELALHKLYLIIGAVFLFYVLVNQPRENLWLVILSIGLWGIITNIIYLLVIDWSIFSADLNALNQIGNWWIRVRPDIQIPGSAVHMFHPNVVGGIDAIIVLLGIASTIHFRHNKKGYLAVLSGVIFLFTGFGLILTSSRAAWVALLIGLTLLGALNIPKTRRFLTRKYILMLWKESSRKDYN